MQESQNNWIVDTGGPIAVEAGDTLANAIRRRLADRILSGDFAASVRLDEQALARQLGVSRTPVREALRQLSAAGLVDLRPRRGAVVVPVDNARVGHAFEAAAEIESAAAAWAATRASLTERKRLIALQEEGARAAQSHDTEHFATVNRRLHAMIHELAGNPSLNEAVVLVRVKVAPYEKAQFLHPHNIDVSHREHQVVVDAICYQDQAAARKYMKQHILRASLAALDQVGPG